MNPILRGTESVESLEQNANKHRDVRDSVNWLLGQHTDGIDFTGRDVDAHGRVKVTAADAFWGRSQAELQAGYEKHRQSQLLNSQPYISLVAEGVTPEIGRATNLATLAQDLNKEKTRKAHAEEERVRSLPGGQKDQWNRQIGLDTQRNKLLDRQQQFTEFEASEGRRERSHNAEMARLDRKAERMDNRDLMALQMREKSLDRAYARERDERADARAARKDRTAMLMQMVQGLAKLGYGMSI